jgi:hypothetical protein
VILPKTKVRHFCHKSKLFRSNRENVVPIPYFRTFIFKSTFLYFPSFYFQICQVCFNLWDFEINSRWPVTFPMNLVYT